jgi:uncharacterized protein (DUF433 family)
MNARHKKRLHRAEGILYTWTVNQKEAKMQKQKTAELLNRITVNPDVMVGKPTIRDLRITVEQILKALGGGITVEELLEDYPELEKEDIQAALLHASELAEEERVYAG